MNSKKVFQVIRKSVIYSLLFSYLSSSFFRWDFNPQNWNYNGRAWFICIYLAYCFISLLINAIVYDISNDKN